MNRPLVTLFAVLIVTPAAWGEDVADPFPRLSPAQAKAVFVAEPGGLRVVTPPAVLTRVLRLPSLWYANSEVALGGDFEVSAAFDVARIGGPNGAHAEGNVELAATARSEYQHVGINVNANPDEGPCFRVVRFSPIRGRTHWNTLAFPRKFDQGRVCLRRRGAEFVFLAADGPDAPLVELVRYPADPRLSPVPRVTAFQGQAADPVALDVRLTDIKVTADRVLRGPVLPPDPPRPTAPASYPVTVDYGPGAAKLLADFPRSNDGGRAFAAEAGGLRIRPPKAAAGAKDPEVYWHRDSRFVLAGDFEVECALDAAVLGPASGTGHGVCNAGFGFETGGPIGSVSVTREVERGGGPRYKVERFSPTRKGPTWDGQTVPAGPGPCRLVARRTGAELVFSAQEGGDAAPREIVRFPFPPDVSPRVRVMAYQGGPPPAPLDVLVSGFKVRATRVHDPDRPDATSAAASAEPGDAVVLDGLPAAPRSRKWRYLAWAGGVLAAAGVAVAGLVWRSRRASGGRS